MRDFYTLLDIVITIGLLSLAAASLVRGGYKNHTNILFSLFSVLTATWIVSNHFSNDITIQSNLALFANYLVLASALGVTIFLSQFVISLAEVNRVRRLMSIAIVPLWIVAISCFSKLMVSDIKIQSNVYAIEFGPLVWVYALCIFFTVSVIGYGLFHGLKYATGVKRRQLLSISYGLGLSVPLIAIFSFIIPLITGEFSLTEFGITPLIILVISLYYGVVRYRLFDIRMAVVRTIVYVFSIATLAGLYIFSAYFIFDVLLNQSDSLVSSPLNIVLTLTLAFLFQPVRDFFDKITNKIFYRDEYSVEVFYAKLSKTLTSTIDMRSLLAKASRVIVDTLKSSQGFFIIFIDNDHFITAGTTSHRQISRSDSEMFKTAKTEFGLILASSLGQDETLRRMMVSHDIEIALPLTRGSDIIGYFFLGEHEASSYSKRDYRNLSALSDELVIAVQNTMSVQAVRELNEGLQQKIHDATKELRASNLQLQKLDKAKDEFVSMASHQLRTPLTSVKGYISMVLEGDVGKITPNQKKLLGEAFSSSERMVHLINDFLNVSRLQTGKFLIEKTSVDLSKVVEQELRSLKSTADSRGLSFVYKAPKNFPVLQLDDSKIRQVIMNYADNAMFYSPEGSKINVSLEAKGKKVIFKVKDKGIGVPKSEQAQLFSKFYRASNARKQRPDGTGVGLFLAKKVIDEHNGQILFESSEGKGSTFGFEIPLS